MSDNNKEHQRPVQRNGEPEASKEAHQPQGRDPLDALLERVRASEKRIQKLAQPHGILGKYGRTAVP